jgi:hypothetical protein
MKLSVRGVALLLGVVAALFTMAVPASASTSTVATTPPPGVAYQLLNLQRGQCLAGQRSNRVNISNCNATFTDQYWIPEPIGEPGFFRLRSLATAKCLAIISNGNVRVSGCEDTFNDQWWRLDAVPGTTNAYQPFNHLRGTCLAAPSSSGAATSFRCEPTFVDQWWSFIPK